MRHDLRQFAKFLGLGLFNTAFGYAIFAVLVVGGVPAQGALAASFAIGILFNYTLSARLIFEARGFGKLPAVCVHLHGHLYAQCPGTPRRLPCSASIR